MNKVRVAAIQCQLGDDYERNVARIEAHVRTAAERGARIILPPELFAGVYFCRTEEPRFFAWAEPFETSRTVQRFLELSKTLHPDRYAGAAPWLEACWSANACRPLMARIQMAYSRV